MPAAAAARTLPVSALQTRPSRLVRTQKLEPRAITSAIQAETSTDYPDLSYPFSYPFSPIRPPIHAEAVSSCKLAALMHLS